MSSRSRDRAGRAVAAILFFTLTIVLAACGYGGEREDQSAAPGTEGDSGVAQASGGGTLRFGYHQGAQRGFDPHISEGVFSQVALNIVYDRLVHLTPDGEPVPGLAESWEFVEDGTVLQLKIRDGVVFHDGEPLDAEAVKANLDQAVEGPQLKAELGVIESVDVVDDSTVNINLNGPAAHLVLALSGKGGMMVSPAALDKPDLDVAPVGAGGWELVEYDPDNLFVFERFEDYWDPEANLLERIEYHIQGDDGTRLIGLETDELDATFIQESAVEDVQATDGLEVLMGTGLPFFGITLNRTHEPLDDVRVRQALNHAIDRQGIVDGLLFGIGEPTASIFPEGYFAHPPEIGPDYYEYDPDRARQLLAEAGYADGFDFDLATLSFGLFPTWAEVVQDMLAEVGVNVKLTLLDAPAWTQYWIVDQIADGATTRGFAQDPSITLQIHYLPDGPRNGGGHSTPEVQELYEQSIATYDPQERAEVLQQLERRIREEAWDIPLWHGKGPLAFNQRVQGLEYWTNQMPEFKGVTVAD